MNGSNTVLSKVATNLVEIEKNQIVFKIAASLVEIEKKSNSVQNCCKFGRIR